MKAIVVEQAHVRRVRLRSTQTVLVAQVRG